MNATVFIQDVLSTPEMISVIAGKVTQGILRVGMFVTIEGKDLKIASIEISRNTVNEAKVGMNVTITIDNEDKTLLKKLVRKSVTFVEPMAQPPAEKVETAQELIQVKKQGFFSKLFKRDN